jgi:hypothetical protein
MTVGRSSLQLHLTQTKSLIKVQAPTDHTSPIRLVPLYTDLKVSAKSVQIPRNHYLKVFLEPKDYAECF